MKSLLINNDALDVAKTRPYSYYALAVLTAINLLNYIDRQILPAVAPLMSKELGLSDSEIGYMESALLLSFTLLAPLFGLLGDRRSRTALLAIAAVIWSAATALCGFIDRFHLLPNELQINLTLINFTLLMSGSGLSLLIIRTVVGVGESSYATIAPSLIADYFPSQRRATALGIFEAAIPVGFALGFVVGGVLAYYFGWRSAFMLVGIPGCITAILLWRLKEPLRGSNDQEKPIEVDKNSIPWWQMIWTVLSTRGWLLSTAGYTAVTFVLGAFATWATTLLVRDKGMNEENAAITIGIIVLSGGAVGSFGGGWIADRWAAYRKDAYFLVCAYSVLLAIIPTIVTLRATDYSILIPAIFIMVTLLFLNNAPFFTILIGSVPFTVRSTAVALNIIAIHTFGDTISRAATGVISDALKAGRMTELTRVAIWLGFDPTHHLSIALLITPVALVISTLLFFLGARSARLDPIE